MSRDLSKDFLAITRIYRNQGLPYAKVLIQPGINTVDHVITPEVSVLIPIKTMYLTPEDQKEIEEIVAKSVDMKPIIEWAKKLDAAHSATTSNSLE